MSRKVGNSRPRRTQAERSAATRQRLLEATVDCLFERGFADTSTPEICRRAGVSRGAQLHHFPTKAKLMSAAAEYLLNKRHAEFRDSYVKNGSSLNISNAIAALWSIYSGPTLRAWQELVNASYSDDNLRAQLLVINQRFFKEAQKTLAALVGEEAGNIPEIAAATRFVFSVLDGLALNRVLEEDDSNARAALSLLEEVGAAWRNRHQLNSAPAPYGTR